MATYYIDYDGGDDANNGLSTGAPWKRHPYMVGWSGSYSHAAGDVFVFKGGVTWPAATLPLTVSAGGSSGAGRDTYKSDATWYAGGSFTKPIFDGEYTRWTCANIDGRSYLTFDGLELCHVNSSSSYGYGIIAGGSISYILVDNCYLHGWRTTNVADDAHGGFIVSNFHATLSDTVVIDRTEITNAENLGVQYNGVCVRGAGTIRRSLIHDNSSGVLFCLDFDRSQLYNIGVTASFDPSYHLNGVYLDPSTMSKSLGYIRNSVFHDVGTGANMAYPNVRGGARVYVYNNLFYGQMSAQLAIEIDPYQYASEGAGHCEVYNNTIVLYEASKVGILIVNRPTKLGSLVVRNNHIIGTSASVTNASASNTVSITSDHNLVQTPAQATAEGYVLGNLYAPTSGGSTIDVGQSVSSLFTDSLNDVTRYSGWNWDLGAYEFEEAVAPTDLIATAAGTSSIHLEWTNNTAEADGVTVERSNDGVSGWTEVADLSEIADSFTDTGLAASMPYYYRVSAYNSLGSSAYTTASATTEPDPVLSSGSSAGSSSSSFLLFF